MEAYAQTHIHSVYYTLNEMGKLQMNTQTNADNA